MNWNNLKSNRCPKCNTLLHPPMMMPMYQCSNSHCDFKIVEARFDKIVNDRYHKKAPAVVMDNQEALNNL